MTAGDFTIELFVYGIPKDSYEPARTEESEIDDFDDIVASFKECWGVIEGADGCACTGRCLGAALALLRRKYDHRYVGLGRWWSDQLHGNLLIRPGDSGRAGAALNEKNYWSGAK